MLVFFVAISVSINVSSPSISLFFFGISSSVSTFISSYFSVSSYVSVSEPNFCVYIWLIVGFFSLICAFLSSLYSSFYITPACNYLLSRIWFLSSKISWTFYLIIWKLFLPFFISFISSVTISVSSSFFLLLYHSTFFFRIYHCVLCTVFVYFYIITYFVYFMRSSANIFFVNSGNHFPFSLLLHH